MINKYQLLIERITFKNSHFYIFLILLILSLFLRFVQIWVNPIQDFDTNSFVLMMQGGFYPHFTSLIDLAHPGLLAVYFSVAQYLEKLLFFPIIYLWSTSISVALALASWLLYLLLKEITDSKLIALIGVTTYILSPTISDIASKSEENIFFHPLYIYIILTIYRFLGNRNTRSLVLISLLSVLVASLHIQPFLIIFGALLLYTLSEWIKSKTQPETNIQNAIKILVAFAIPGFLYYLIIHYAFYNPMVVKAYSNNIYSLFHNDSLAHYLEAFLLFLQGHLFTGEFPVVSMTLLNIEPTISATTLGFIFLIFIFAMLTRRTFIDCSLLASLGFVFIYEPTISERWDTVLISLIAVIVVHLSSSTGNNFFKSKLWLVIPCTTIITIGTFKIPENIHAIKTTFTTQQAVDKELNASREIFTDLDSGQRFVVNLSPRNAVFRNLAGTHPSVGSLVFLENGGQIIKKQFNVDCLPTKIPNLCAVAANN